MGSTSDREAVKKCLLATIKLFPKPKRSVTGGNQYTEDNLLQAVELACGDMSVECCQDWIRLTRGFFPCCLARNNVAFDANKVHWQTQHKDLKPRQKECLNDLDFAVAQHF
jgi:Tfp pilus assembly protein PilV